MKEFKHLKEDESDRLNFEWNFQRTFSKSTTTFIQLPLKKI